jgi:hypothetical protein
MPRTKTKMIPNDRRLRWLTTGLPITRGELGKG